MEKNRFFSNLRMMALCLGVGLPATAGLAATVPAAGEQGAAAGTTILDAKDTFWRYVTIARPFVIAGETGAAERTTLGNKKISAELADKPDMPMPDGWTGVKFDDAAWPRIPGRRMPNMVHLTDTASMSCQPHLKVAVLCLRGKFIVDDPAAAGPMTLTVKYRGGVAAFLNGREIARSDLSAGKLTEASVATPYPDSAFVDAAGKPLTPADRVKPTDKETCDAIAARDRSLFVEVPAAALLKGVNVLALEIHRSDYHRVALKFTDGNFFGGWTTYGLIGLRLATTGTGVTPNTSRPAGLQVWNQDRMDRTTVADYGDPAEPVGPIMLTAARNGTVSGKVVVSSDKAIDGLKAELGGLTLVGGKGTLPTASMKVRYSTPVVEGAYGDKWYEALSDEPAEKSVPAPKGGAPQRIVPGSKGGAVQPVWVTVRVGSDTPAGDYAGTLTVSAGGAKVADVPVRLHVADWTIPPPQKFRAFVGLYQSPTAIAANYGVPEWSDKHWDLLDSSFELLGELGNQMVNIDVVDKTKFGNDDGMVYWVRKADGGYDYDFTVFDRYLKLVKKHLGVPKFVVLNLYHAGGWTEAGAHQENTVTVLDPATGKRDHVQVPDFGTEESRNFWTPVLTAMKARLAAEGMEKSLVLGSLCEKPPKPEESKVFADILGPDFTWLQITHAAHGSLDQPHQPLAGGGRIDFHIFTYLPDLPTVVPPLHKPYWPRVAYYRRAQGISVSQIAYRTLATDALFLRLPGFSQACLDYWPTEGGRKDRGGLLFGRWPRSSNYPGDPEPAYLTWPGPKGAAPLTSFESVREGLQEAEAMIVISEALEKNGASMKPDLAEKCRRVLADELAFCRDRDYTKYQFVTYNMNHYGWQDISSRLFDLAGAVSKP